MISELDFARKHSSFWKKSFPFISRVVRKLNLQKERYCEHIVSKVDSGRRALVNETGFRLYEYQINNNLFDLVEISNDDLEKIKSRCLEYIARLQGKVRYATLGEFTKEELKEAYQIAYSIYAYFEDYEDRDSLIVSPSFQGCGLLNSCYGDVYCNSTIYEIKAGERDFKGDDVKQLLIYCTLANLQKLHHIKNIGLLNPRSGEYTWVAVSEAIGIASGMELQEAYSEIANYLDSPEDFR